MSTEQLTSEQIVTEVVNVANHSPASILILEAMVSHVGNDGDIMKAFGCTSADVDVQLLVNGVSVDIVKSLSEAWARLEAHFEERAKEKALEMIKGAGLKDMLDTIERAEWTIREKLEAVCPTR